MRLKIMLHSARLICLSSCSDHTQLESLTRDLPLSIMTPVVKEVASTHTVILCLSTHQSLCANWVMMFVSIQVGWFPHHIVPASCHGSRAPFYECGCNMEPATCLQTSSQLLAQGKDALTSEQVRQQWEVTIVTLLQFTPLVPDMQSLWILTCQSELLKMCPSQYGPLNDFVLCDQEIHICSHD